MVPVEEYPWEFPQEIEVLLVDYGNLISPCAAPAIMGEVSETMYDFIDQLHSATCLWFWAVTSQPGALSPEGK